MALSNTSSIGHVTTGEFSPVQQSFKYTARTGRKILESDSFFCPEEYARAQAVRLHQAPLSKDHLGHLAWRRAAARMPIADSCSDTFRSNKPFLEPE
ncbi:MAG TPA: hypothetical protein VNB49_00140 [Candidatus Dormibacteraeota bacterium]|nr:hypothetical protein [Candidatus Dormibacteraeota bacterium]